MNCKIRRECLYISGFSKNIEKGFTLDTIKQTLINLQEEKFYNRVVFDFHNENQMISMSIGIMINTFKFLKLEMGINIYFQNLTQNFETLLSNLKLDKFFGIDNSFLIDKVLIIMEKLNKNEISIFEKKIKECEDYFEVHNLLDIYLRKIQC